MGNKQLQSSSTLAVIDFGSVRWKVALLRTHRLHHGPLRTAVLRIQTDSLTKHTGSSDIPSFSANDKRSTVSHFIAYEEFIRKHVSLGWLGVEMMF